ncbi:MAG TPA: BON domain-containing protein [Ramlibacter sp.]|nr:BON domain-containing protein [Ramlibacter sp.]
MRNVLLAAVAAALGATAVYYLDAAVERRRRERDALANTDAHIDKQVRALIEFIAANPDAVEVTVADGLVRLAGRVPRGEINRLLLGTRDVAGVKMVYNSLTPLEDGIGPAATSRPARDAA